MSGPGIVVFLPWLTLPEPVELGGFVFVPLRADALDGVVTDERTATCIVAMLSSYVDTQNRPITSCTIVTDTHAKVPWYINESDLNEAHSAVRTLGLVLMSEQRFCEPHFSPHINATVFRPIVQRLSPPSDRLTLTVQRRDGELLHGGLKFGDLKFQQPLQTHDTKCPEPPREFITALDRERRDGTEIWSDIEGSLPVWLLGNAEELTLSDEACVTLCAIAFERLLRSSGGALDFSKRFAQLWVPFSRTNVAGARRVQADPKFFDQQQSLPACQKWAKELYEQRSQFAHQVARRDFSRNWEPWQHVLLAAYSYPLTIKLILEGDGRYELSPAERGCCFALDPLLDRWEPRAHDPLNEDEDWDNFDEKYGRPTWSSIVGMERENETIRRLLENVGTEPSKGGKGGRV